MKKQFKDLSEEELDENIDNPLIISLIDMYEHYDNKKSKNLKEKYNSICKLKKILEQEINIKEEN